MTPASPAWICGNCVLRRARRSIIAPKRLRDGSSLHNGAPAERGRGRDRDRGTRYTASFERSALTMASTSVRSLVAANW